LHIKFGYKSVCPYFAAMGNHEERHDSPTNLEMRFLRSVTGYTRLDKISEVTRKELEISGIQDVRLKYRQNWINHIERTDNTRLPKYALNCKPRGRRDSGRPRKRWQCFDAGTVQTTQSMEKDDDDDDDDDESVC